MLVESTSIDSYENDIMASVKLRNAYIPGAPKIFAHVPFFDKEADGKAAHAILFEDGGRCSAGWDAVVFMNSRMENAQSEMTAYGLH